MKRILLALGVLSLLGTVAYADSVTPVTGPQDPSQLNNIINTLIISGNTQWNPASAGAYTAANISPNASSTITISNVGPTGITTSTIIEWLRIKNPSGKWRFVPLWGCSAPNTGC